MTVRRSLSLQSDGWIADHAIDGKLILPVIGLELMAAAAMLLDPGHAYSGAKKRSVYARKAAWRYHGSHRGHSNGGWRENQSSFIENHTHRSVIETDHFSAEICWDIPSMNPLPPMGMPDHPITAAEIYNRFFQRFHFPRCRIHSRDNRCIVGRWHGDSHIDFRGLISLPLVLEAVSGGRLASDDVGWRDGTSQAIDLYRI